MTAAAEPSDIDKHLLGITILVALLLGGGTQPGLTTDTIVQLLAIAVSAFVILRHPERPIDKRVLWFMIAANAVILFQLLPVPIAALRATQGILQPIDAPSLGEVSGTTLSLGPGRTIEVAGYFMTLCLFATAVMKLRFNQAFALIPFFLAGVVLNLAAALIQYSFAGSGMMRGIFAYHIWGGFFANPNHFSTLIFISIPLAFAYLISVERLVVFVIYLILALLVLLAAGSMAGVAIGLAITVLSAAVLLQRSRIGLVSTLVGSVVIGVFAVAAGAQIQVEDFQAGYGRWEFARTTLAGALDNLPFGIGFGNFVTGYPSYESGDMIFNTYVNHAHNDYLELLFEGGLPAALLIVAFLVLLVKRIWETISSPFHVAVGLAVLFVLVHSGVDYPLRTLAIALSFAMLLGLLFHRNPQARPDPDRVAAVKLDDRIVMVPMTGDPPGR